MRALYMCLPSSFKVDGDGKKQKWLSEFREKMMRLTDLEDKQLLHRPQKLHDIYFYTPCLLNNANLPLQLVKADHRLDGLVLMVGACLYYGIGWTMWACGASCMGMYLVLVYVCRFLKHNQTWFVFMEDKDVRLWLNTNFYGLDYCFFGAGRDGHCVCMGVGPFTVDCTCVGV